MHKKILSKHLLILIPLLIILIVGLVCFPSKTGKSVYTSSNLISEAVSLRADVVPVPIIMYHQVKYSRPGKDSVTPEEFESDLKYLEKNGYQTINMHQLIHYVYNDEDLPANPIIISFDDGYLSNYKYVFPLLKKYNQKIVLSIIGKSTDDFSKIPDSNIEYSHITWEQLNEMMESGFVEVQNHTYNMHVKAKGRTGCTQKSGESLEQYRTALCEDINNLQDEIASVTGYVPTTFAYPYGRYNETTDLILKEMGFKATLSCDFGINLITKEPDDLYRLKRMCRSCNREVGSLIDKGIETLKYRKIKAGKSK